MLREALIEKYLSRHPVEAARQLERFTPGEAARTLLERPAALAGGVLGRLHPMLASECLRAMPEEAGAAVLAAMPVHDAAAVLRRLDTAARREFLKRLDADAARSIRRLLRNPEGTVSALMDPLAPAAPVNLSVGEGLGLLKIRPAAGFLYLLDDEHRPLGGVRAGELLAAGTDSLLGSLPRQEAPPLPAGVSLEAALRLPAWRDCDELPVAAPDGRFAGGLSHRRLRTAVDSAPVPAVERGSSLGAVLPAAETMWLGLFSVLEGALWSGAAANDEGGESR